MVCKYDISEISSFWTYDVATAEEENSILRVIGADCYYIGCKSFIKMMVGII
jgi:hypothetical protein